MNRKTLTVRDYVKLPYTVILRRDEDGDVIARIKELEGCVADGQDELEALGNLEAVKDLWISTAVKAGQTIPLPESDDELPSGKFLARVPRSLHRRLIDIAQDEGVSLNQLVMVSLTEASARKSAVELHNKSTKGLPGTVQGLSGAAEYGLSTKRPHLQVISRYGGKQSLEETSDPEVIKRLVGGSVAVGQ